MNTLTSRQRDILKEICQANRPLTVAEISSRLNLSTRQVNYCLQNVRTWLKLQGMDLVSTNGAGFAVGLSAQDATDLMKRLDVQAEVQIILSVSQRQQLLALFLLTHPEPVIVSQLEQTAQVSRMTLVKDLDRIEGWLESRKICLVRKQHFGVQVQGSESAIRQALAEVIWGETPFSADRVTEISHADGLVFALQGDATQLPLIGGVEQFLNRMNLIRAINLVAKAEEQLGSRFSDDAVLHLALVFAIMAVRVQNKHHLDLEAGLVERMQDLHIWPVAAFIAERLGRDTRSTWQVEDIAGVAMELVSAPRNEILPGSLDDEFEFNVLIDQVMEAISQAYGITKLKHDRTLYNGLVNNIIPACYRQRFSLWFPVSLNTASLPDAPEREQQIAAEIARLVQMHSGVELPQNELNNLVALLRAGYIRNRTYPYEKVIVVCPSGMATAQLLVARVKAHFPYLTNLDVISLRDLTTSLVASTDMVLTTVPLPRAFVNNPKVILVHPILMPEDIEAITQFLS